MFEQMRRSRDWIAHIADIQMADLPGARFVYKEWDVILLSALIGKVCGGSTWDFCNTNLYQPLEIVSDKWMQSKCGVDYPSSDDDGTSDLSAHDMAKIGLLMLNDGKWGKQRVISSEYIKEAVSPSQINSGYGLLFWLSENGYHGRGFGGQELNIYPDKNVIVVIQATVTSSSKSYPDISGNINERIDLQRRYKSGY
jgi:CubicO group peptidase (beta-lactamase class C family)